MTTEYFFIYFFMSLSSQVVQHKTNQVYGAATVYLTAEEFSWVQRWMVIKADQPEDEKKQ